MERSSLTVNFVTDVIAKSQISTGIKSKDIFRDVKARFCALFFLTVFGTLDTIQYTAKIIGNAGKYVFTLNRETRTKAGKLFRKNISNAAVSGTLAVPGYNLLAFLAPNTATGLAKNFSDIKEEKKAETAKKAAAKAKAEKAKRRAAAKAKRKAAARVVPPPTPEVKKKIDATVSTYGELIEQLELLTKETKVLRLHFDYTKPQLEEAKALIKALSLGINLRRLEITGKIALTDDQQRMLLGVITKGKLRTIITPPTPKKVKVPLKKKDIPGSRRNTVMRHSMVKKLNKILKEKGRKVVLVENTKTYRKWEVQKIENDASVKEKTLPAEVV